MNTPTTPQPTPDLESLRKAIQEFRPNPHRVPFNNLKPFHDSIVELRGKKASYVIIAEILQQYGIKVRLSAALRVPPLTRRPAPGVLPL